MRFKFLPTELKDYAGAVVMFEAAAPLQNSKGVQRSSSAPLWDNICYQFSNDKTMRKLCLVPPSDNGVIVEVSVNNIRKAKRSAATSFQQRSLSLFKLSFCYQTPSPAQRKLLRTARIAEVGQMFLLSKSKNVNDMIGCEG